MCLHFYAHTCCPSMGMAIDGRLLWWSSPTHHPLFAQGLVFPLRLADVTLSCYGLCAFVSRRLGERDSTHCSPTNAWAGSVWCMDHLVVAFVVGTTPCVVQRKCESQDVTVCACAFMTCISERRVWFSVCIVVLLFCWCCSRLYSPTSSRLCCL